MEHIKDLLAGLASELLEQRLKDPDFYASAAKIPQTNDEWVMLFVESMVKAAHAVDTLAERGVDPRVTADMRRAAIALLSAP